MKNTKMKPHQIWSERLQDYLNGLLSRDARTEFEAHLDECETCQKVVANALAIRGQLQKPPRVSLSPEMRLRLYQRMNATRAARGEPLLRIPQSLMNTVAEEAAQLAAAGAETAGSLANKAAHSVAGTVETIRESELPQAATNLPRAGLNTLTDKGREVKGVLDSLIQRGKTPKGDSRDAADSPEET